MREKECRIRVGIEEVQPEIDQGRFPIKRTVGEKVQGEADIFTDGHDLVSGVLLYRRQGESVWQETPMTLVENDRWRGEFRVMDLGSYQYTVQAWIDHFLTWRRDLVRKIKVGQAIAIDLLTGALLVEAAARRASGKDKKKLLGIRTFLRA